MKQKYIINYAVQLVLTAVLIGAVVWYYLQLQVDPPLVTVWSFDLAQFYMVIGLFFLAVLHFILLLVFLIAAVRQRKKPDVCHSLSTARFVLPVLFIFLAPFVFTFSFLATDSYGTLQTPLAVSTVCDDLQTRAEAFKTADHAEINANPVSGYTKSAVYEQNALGKLGYAGVSYSPYNSKDSSVDFTCYFADSKVDFVRKKICNTTDADFALKNKEQAGDYTLYYETTQEDDLTVMEYTLVQETGSHLVWAACRVEQTALRPVHYTKTQFTKDALAVLGEWRSDM